MGRNGHTKRLRIVELGYPSRKKRASPGARFSGWRYPLRHRDWVGFRPRSFPRRSEEGLPQSPPQRRREKTSLSPLAQFRRFRCSTPAEKQFFQFHQGLLLKVPPPPDSFSCHRMAIEAIYVILWPVFPRKPLFSCHRMTKCALPAILCPGNWQKNILCPVFSYFYTLNRMAIYDNICSD